MLIAALLLLIVVLLVALAYFILLKRDIRSISRKLDEIMKSTTNSNWAIYKWWNRIRPRPKRRRNIWLSSKSGWSRSRSCWTSSLSFQKSTAGPVILNGAFCTELVEGISILPT
jgi:hypothetical protein